MRWALSSRLYRDKQTLNRVRTLQHAADRGELRRLRGVKPDSVRQWGACARAPPRFVSRGSWGVEDAGAVGAIPWRASQVVRPRRPGVVGFRFGFDLDEVRGSVGKPKNCPRFCPRFGLHRAPWHARLLPKTTRPRAHNSLGRLRLPLRRLHFANVARIVSQCYAPGFVIVAQLPGVPVSLYHADYAPPEAPVRPRAGREVGATWAC